MGVTLLLTVFLWFIINSKVEKADVPAKDTQVTLFM